jgi:hypothetical protein
MRARVGALLSAGRRIGQDKGCIGKGKEGKGSYGSENATKDETKAYVSIMMRLILCRGGMSRIGRVGLS